MHAETGARHWSFRYPTDFEDRYGYNNGPRSSPVVDGDRVLHGRRARTTALPRPALGQARMGAQHRRRVQGAAGFLRHGFDSARRGHSFSSSTWARRADRASSGSTRRRDAKCGARARNGGRVMRRPFLPSCTANAGSSCSPAASRRRRRGGLLSIDPATGRVDFSFPWRSRSYESVNASCPVVFDNKVFISASYRTGGALLEIRPDFTHRVAVDDAGVRPPLEHADLPERIPVRIRRPQRARCLARLHRCGKRKSRMACDAGMERDLHGRRHAPAAAARRVSRIAAGRRRPVPLPGRDGTPGVDGSHAEGLQGDFARWLFAARESWALPVLSRGLLYVVQNTRDVVNGALPGAALLRHAY